MTPEDAREAQKQIEKLLAERKIEQEAIKAARDEKLQSIGIDASDDYFLEKLVEVRQIADSVEKQAVKEAAEMLEKIPKASEAEGSVAIVSEAPAQVIKTSNIPLIIPSSISPSNDSDLDDVPISRRMRNCLNPLHNLNRQPLNYPFRLNSLQQLLNVLRILKTHRHLTYPSVTHPQTCSP